MRKRTSNPKDFGRVGVLMGERGCVASMLASRANARPRMAGPVLIEASPSRHGRHAQAARGTAHA